ncbi:GH25 family lysozyme [Caballeronia cordobensis]|uniref:GH25 family lysozyme n=1 Tax=Caballeronia cordobensis TaxID=1353886 RepID=UPI00045F0097|nr:putative membrane protein [Burkholderia sp. RPE67]
MHKLGFFAATALVVAQPAALAQSTNTNTGDSVVDLQPLQNEPSRADLFELITAAANADDPETKKDATKFFALNGPFKFPNDALYDIVENKDRVDSIFGADVSHHTGADFPIETLSQKQVKFLYLKATQGTGFKDSKFASFWQRLEKLPPGEKIHRGAYHFLSSDGDGAAQGATFVRFVKAHGGLKSTDMPPVVDLEWDKANVSSEDRWKGKSPDQIINSTKAWLETVEKGLGRKPMIYTARAWWRERIGDEAKFSALAAYPIWIADYSKTARAVEIPKVPNSSKWVLWQYTDRATMKTGYARGFDANIFKGKEAEFYEALQVQRF